MTRWLSVRAVAKRYGISTDKIYRDIQKGVLPAYTVGGLMRIREDDAQNYQRKLEPRNEASMLLDAIWRGPEPVFARALSALVHVPIHAEAATVVVMRAEKATARLFTFGVNDGGTELILQQTPDGFEVSRRIGGRPIGRVVPLTVAGAAAAWELCEALMKRLEAHGVQETLH